MNPKIIFEEKRHKDVEKQRYKEKLDNWFNQIKQRFPSLRHNLPYKTPCFLLHHEKGYITVEGEKDGPGATAWVCLNCGKVNLRGFGHIPYQDGFIGYLDIDDKRLKFRKDDDGDISIGLAW
jgi:hypothetical protein